jgi:hypothetical protein
MERIKMKTNKLEELILAEMERSDFDVFLRSDFAHLDNYQQIGKALSQLRVKSKVLRIGQGLYCLAEVSSFFPEDVIPKAKALPLLAREALTRLGYEVVLSTAEIDNLERRSTQVPTGRRIGIKGKQPHLKIGRGSVYITYENVR